MLNWRNAYIVSIALRFYLALSNSYIHPDEHFQNFEVLTNSIFGFTTQLPWEFTSDTPARSLGPLYLVYGPILYIIKLLGLNFTPIQIWYLVRLQFLFLTWVSTDYCVYRILPTRPERVKGVFFILTSYITLIYQSHCFSNSIETVLVLFSVLLIDELRFYTNENKKQLKWNYFILGALVSIGVFNRVSFPAFLILPLIFVFNHLKYTDTKLVSIALGASGLILPSLVFIVVDSIGFGNWNPSDISTYVITPWNNLIYNANIENLAQHGIHPIYTHLLVNLPQLFGPAGLMFLFYKGNKYYRTTPFITFVSGILGLSLVPHQELRFLIPLVPLGCCCFDIEKFQPIEPKPKPKPNEVPIKKSKNDIEVESKDGSEGDDEMLNPPILVSVSIIVWYLFNIIFGVLMGIFHQGGVLPALDYLSPTMSIAGNSSTAQIWWRTYTPPTWILGNRDNSLQIITSTSESQQNIYQEKQHMLIDSMGSEYLYIQSLTDRLLELGISKIYLITPVSSYLTVVKTSQFQSVWNYTYHLDLDHIDFGDLRTLSPGLGIYELI